ncbi:MAG: ferritin [Patescibacteria group bacterium]|jgi:ferritin
MTEKTKEIINQQIKEEFYSAYLYIALAARLESLNLKGAAAWMQVQAKEENDHALGFFRFLVQRSEEPKLLALAEPKIAELKNIGAIFSAGLEHEKHITALIYKIYEVAREEKDYALESFIRWYIDEQREEEANSVDIIEKIKMIGDNGSALYLLDQELSTRAYTPSSPYTTGAVK